MTVNGFHSAGSSQSLGAGGVGEPQRVAEVFRHVAFALSQHVRRLHQDALPVPREVEELTLFLAHLARTRQDASNLAEEAATTQYACMPDRLLITKSEAAQRLCVSVRTVERLVATGRLPQVRVERLARFRVSDLEAYVKGLAESNGPDFDLGNDSAP